jgi:hypothetical protein
MQRIVLLHIGASSLGASAAVAAATAAAAAAGGGSLAQPPPPDKPPPRDVPGVAVPPGLEEAAAAAAASGTPYGSYTFGGDYGGGEEDDNEDIALGDSVRYHAGSGGAAGGLGRDSGWGLEPGVVSPVSHGRSVVADEAYDTFTDHGQTAGGAVPRDYSHYGNAAARGGAVGVGRAGAASGGGGKKSDMNMSSGRGGALSALFNSLPGGNSSEPDDV